MEFVDGNLCRIENMFEGSGRNRVLTMQRNHGISLRIISMTDERMTARLPHAYEPDSLQFLQKLPRRQTR